MNGETVKLIGILTAIFPNHLSAEGVRAYANLLEDVPAVVLKTAMEQCAKDCKFFPSVAEIRDRATKISTVGPENAAEAWEDVMIAMKRDGFYRQPKFENAITQRAVAAMDWQALCSSENTIADRAHFMKIYDQLIEPLKQNAKLTPNARALREELTNERRQISTTSTDAKTENGSGDGIRPRREGKV
jgi:hypothetical protein